MTARKRMSSEALQALAWREHVNVEIKSADGEAVVKLRGVEYWASLHDKPVGRTT